MIVHFSSSTGMIKQRYDLLQKIRGYILDSGCTLARDWLVEIDKDYTGENKNPQEWQSISEKTINALKSADAVIIEVSIDSFSMGYQAAMSLQLKKPLLLLRNDSSSVEVMLEESKSKKIEETIIAGNKAHYKIIQNYKNDEELKQHINDFVEQNQLDTRDMRFNMFLDRRTFKYLNEISEENGKTKARIIRDLLRAQQDKEK